MAPLNVTPMTLSEMVKTLVEDSGNKDQISQLQNSYAKGEIAKDKFTGLLGDICGTEVMVKALQIMVPGYDEMRGVVPSSPAPAAPPPSRPAEAAAKAEPPNLKKGFLADGSIASKDGDSPGMPTLPKPKEAGSTLDGVDVVSMREHIYSHMQEAVPIMDKEHRDHLLHNNFVMHDAQSAGNAGNVVLGPGGVAKVLTEDSMGGKAERYTWGQNEAEVTIKVGNLPKGTKAKDVKLVSASESIKLHVCGQQMCAGSLHKPVLADESTFVIEDEPESDGGTRQVVVTLIKRDKTGGQGHWPCVVVGDDGKIDTTKFGAQVCVADPNKPHEFVEAMKSLEVRSGRRVEGHPQLA